MDKNRFLTRIFIIADLLVFKIAKLYTLLNPLLHYLKIKYQ